jgi:hypothetical protein
VKSIKSSYLVFEKHKVKQCQAVGLVLIQEGEANEAKLNEELKLVVNDKWDF